MRRIFNIILFLLPLFLYGQTYVPSFVNPQVVNGKFRVTLALASSGGSFLLGDANFKYNYVRNALDNGVVISQTSDFSSRYTVTTTGTGLTIGRQHLNIVPNSYSNVLSISSTPTELFTMEYDIVDAVNFPTATFNWRITSPATNINSSPYGTNGTTGNLTTLAMVTSPTATQPLTASITNTSASLTNIPLPVELTSFSGKAVGKANELSWVSSVEDNLRGYEVERSADGTSFRAIGSMISPNATKRYVQIDNSPMPMSYYRLKMIDFDGTTKYSQVVKVSRKDLGSTVVSVSPNPTKGESWVEYNSERRGNVEVRIIDTQGRVLQTLSPSVEQGYNKLNIDLSAYAQGADRKSVV